MFPNAGCWDPTAAATPLGILIAESKCPWPKSRDRSSVCTLLPMWTKIKAKTKQRDKDKTSVPPEGWPSRLFRVFPGVYPRTHNPHNHHSNPDTAEKFPHRTTKCKKPMLAH